MEQWSQMRFEKKHIQQLMHYTPSASMLLLFVDEKGPTTVKAHGGTSWSSVQVKVEGAQKTNGIPNVFGAGDHMNGKMHVHC